MSGPGAAQSQIYVEFTLGTYSTYYGALHCKKGYWFSRPQAECHWANSLWPGIIQFLPAGESLVSDIPAGDGKIGNLFLQCVLSWLGHSALVKTHFQTLIQIKLWNWFRGKQFRGIYCSFMLWYIIPVLVGCLRNAVCFSTSLLLCAIQNC
jgi:hypothetical protein